MPQNAIADYFDLPSLHTDSEKFKKTVGVKNSVKEYYQGQVVKLREHAKKVDTQYQDGIYDSFKNGDVIDVSGFTSPQNNGIFVSVAVSALEIIVEHFDEDGVLVTEAAGDTVTILAKGKST